MCVEVLEEKCTDCNLSMLWAKLFEKSSRCHRLVLYQHHKIGSMTMLVAIMLSCFGTEFKPQIFMTAKTLGFPIPGTSCFPLSVRYVSVVFFSCLCVYFSTVSITIAFTFTSYENTFFNFRPHFVDFRLVFEAFRRPHSSREISNDFRIFKFQNNCSKFKSSQNKERNTAMWVLSCNPTSVTCYPTHAHCSSLKVRPTSATWHKSAVTVTHL